MWPCIIPWRATLYHNVNVSCVLATTEINQKVPTYPADDRKLLRLEVPILFLSWNIRGPTRILQSCNIANSNTGTQTSSLAPFRFRPEYKALGKKCVAKKHASQSVQWQPTANKSNAASPSPAL
jgi:hypothetical protein